MDARSTQTTSSANAGGDDGSVSVDSSPGEEGGGGAPKRSLRSGVAPRLRSRSASTWDARVRVVDDNLFVVGRLAWQENGRMIVYRSRVSSVFQGR